MDLKYDPILGVLRKSDGQSGTDTSDATAVAGDILNGKTAYGADGKLTGTLVPLDTSDANATAGNILSGKTAYVNGKKITGTISSYTGSSLIIPGVADKVISNADRIYLPKAVKVAGESELLAENIKKDVSIFGIVGTLESSGGTSAEYYKCASVDTEAKTWSGYKAVFDSTAGTWSFESDVTEGLAYTSVTPIVGGIYSADALVIVSLLYTGTPTLTSPTGMTSESSDEWEISAKSNYNAYYPWKAFDGLSSPFTNCRSSQTAKDQWLQWHNKKQKVLVQRLKLSVTDAPAQGPAEFILQGSDDGTLWHDIHSESGLSWTTNGEAKEFAFSNNKSYYYHRLNEMWADSNVVSILELETYDL